VTTLEALVEQWRGRRATFVLDIAGEETTYEGILDGPYLGESPTVSFALGSRLISGDSAVGGSYVSIEARRDNQGGKSRLVSQRYVELKVRELPRDIRIEGHTATWTLELVDGSSAACRLDDQASGSNDEVLPSND
jgi:hypothetical protein